MKISKKEEDKMAKPVLKKTTPRVLTPEEQAARIRFVGQKDDIRIIKNPKKKGGRRKAM